MDYDSKKNKVTYLLLIIFVSLTTTLVSYYSYSTKYFLNLNLKSNYNNQIKLYFAKEGDVYSEKQTIYLPILGDNQYHSYGFQVPSGLYNEFRIRLFVDSNVAESVVELNQVTITNSMGNVVKNYNLSDIKPLSPEVKIDSYSSYITLRQTPNAKDPNILIVAPVDLVVYKADRTKFVLFMFIVSIILMLILGYMVLHKKEMKEVVRLHQTKLNILFYTICLLFFTAMWLKQVQPFIEDDGAFFLQYAVNMSKGYFWKYNIQDINPVWGSSAPLWPLVIAFFIKLGLYPVLASHIAAYTCAILFVLISAYTFDKKFSKLAALLFIVFISLDPHIQHYFTSGLESPLTALMLSLLLAVAFDIITNSVFIGLILGILCVQKIDLIPIVLVSFCFLIYFRGMDKKALGVAIAVVITWYSFAWIYFGFPLPNSFLTKFLHQGGMISTTSHFWIINFFMGQIWAVGIWMIIPLLLIAFRQYKLQILVFSFLVIINLLGYTIDKPFEPYNWYAIPAIVGYYYLLVIGFSYFANLFKNYQKSLILCLIILIFFTTQFSAYCLSAKYVMRANTDDADRANAGKWVNENTIDTATVYTGWGLPAFYSKRYVYDFSFLNRTYEKVDLVAKYKPDVIIFQGQVKNVDSKPVCYNDNLKQHYPNYFVVKQFIGYYNLTGDKNYCFFVMIDNKNILKPRSE